MTVAPPLNIPLHSIDASVRFSRRLAAVLRPGDSVLLSGPIGAGKTLICRHLIQSLLIVPEDVPSPTFTLVQTYDTRAGPLWHADLYRLTAADEVLELGLVDAFDSAICLVEWPDRLGTDTPKSALNIDIAPDPDEPDWRHVRMTWTDPKWNRKLENQCDE